MSHDTDGAEHILKYSRVDCHPVGQQLSITRTRIDRTMAPLMVTPAVEGDASEVAEVHLKAMDSNELIHAQFPSPDALDFLRSYLEKETVEFLQSSDKGVLVAKDSQSGEIASFIKWVVHHGDAEELSPADDIWPSFCRTEYLNPYANLTASIRKSVIGSDSYYREFLALKVNDANGLNMCMLDSDGVLRAHH